MGGRNPIAEDEWQMAARIFICDSEFVGVPEELQARKTSRDVKGI